MELIIPITLMELMTDGIKVIAEMLGKGKENAIPLKDLCSMLHIKYERDLQRMVAKERKEGALILSDASATGGYYLPANRHEIEMFVKTQEKRALSLLKVIKAAKAELQETEGQTEMNLYSDDPERGIKGDSY